MLVDGPTKESFTNDNAFIRNILQFKDKEFRIDTKLFAIVEEVDV